jgi:hypothetical protein
MQDKGQLLTAKQIAERLNVSLRLAQRLMKEMKPVNVGAGVKQQFLRVKPAELEAWINRRVKEPEPAGPMPELKLIRPRRKPKLNPFCPPPINGRIPNRR